MRLISVVLGSDSVKQREQASATLLGYGYSFYQTVKVKGRGEVAGHPARVPLRIHHRPGGHSPRTCMSPSAATRPRA